jgi:hypothetical protein
MADFQLDITGSAPLLMHSARLSDPLNPATRALAKVTGKRKKTEDDHDEAARLEHAGSLYLDKDFGPYIPGANVEACLFRGASKFKLMSTLKTALLIPQEVNALVYKGPRTQEGLWKDKAFVHRTSVKVGQSRVIRTRPVFHTWAVSVSGSLEIDLVDPGAFEQIVEASGKLVGLGDWRPRFGRFKAEVKWS